MNKYTKLSDFEINKKVARIRLTDGNYGWCAHTGLVKRYVTDDKGLCMTYDPCNNPSDAMPIIIENGISMVRVNSTWSARQFNNHCIEINGDSYYRIAMEVYLLMNGK
ncbi:phage protein NinX family protein [Providencia sp. PROV130]|uniref:phage protein NinX family protein n=1 Tax=Providencia sp. PROV130 TaxID=2949840 RepID=UPI00234B501A|nr:phage protein NinX family protein [Providencia sp. PROV130]